MSLRENQILAQHMVPFERSKIHYGSVSKKEQSNPMSGSSYAGCLSSEDISLVVGKEKESSEPYSEDSLAIRVGRVTLEENSSDKLEGRNQSIFSFPYTLPRKAHDSSSFCQEASDESTSSSSQSSSESSSNNSHVTHLNNRSLVYTRSFLSKCKENGCQIDSRHVQKIHSIALPSESSLPSSSSSAIFSEEDYVTKL